VDAIVLQIRNRVIEGYQSHQGRQNQLQVEIRRLNGNPEQGRILRKLYHALPEEGLGTTVRSAIQEVAERRSSSSAHEGPELEIGSGSQALPLGAACTGSGC
jgi:hypothetical protein